jgi:hypothetical protein
LTCVKFSGVFQSCGGPVRLLINELAECLTCVKARPAVFRDTDGVKPVLETMGVEAKEQSVTGTKLQLPLNISASQRLVREWKTMAAMVRCYCQDHHETTAGLCLECRGLLDYATLRLDRCRFGAGKPICAHCPVHCYQRNQRDQVKTVMRYAGPRMLGRHPILSLRHWWDGFRKAPPLNNEAAHAGNF